MTHHRFVDDAVRRDSELDELEAPEPESFAKRERYLEDDQDYAETAAAGNSRRLHEVDAPAPVNDENTHDDSLKDSTLESRHASHASQDDYSPALTELYTVSWLIFFSFWGTLARLGVEAITLYPNSPFPSRVLWANLGGSFVIGFLTEDRKLFQQEWGSGSTSLARQANAAEHTKVKKTIPLYIGLATGFCGCFTSFSSFMRDAFLALTNALEGPSPTTPYHVDAVVHSRNGGFSFLALLAILIVHPAVSLGALTVGAHCAVVARPITPTIPFQLTRQVLDPAAAVLGFGCWLAAVFMSIWPPGNDVHWRFRATFPLVFSPPGCLLRFYLSKYLNGRIRAFPLGTFTANMLGTIVLGAAWDLQHASGIGAQPGMHVSACSVLQGVMEGFCGCLTTVSTWVLELDTLRRHHAWVYGLSSMAVGLALMVVIMGGMGWTIGFGTPGCS